MHILKDRFGILSERGIVTAAAPHPGQLESVNFFFMLFLARQITISISRIERRVNSNFVAVAPPEARPERTILFSHVPRSLRVFDSAATAAATAAIVVASRLDDSWRS